MLYLDRHGDVSVRDASNDCAVSLRLGSGNTDMLYRSVEDCSLKLTQPSCVRNTSRRTEKKETSFFINDKT